MWYTVVYGSQINHQAVVKLISNVMKEAYVSEEYLKFTSDHPDKNMDDFVDQCIEEYFDEEQSLLADILYDIHPEIILQYVDPVLVPGCKEYIIGIQLIEEQECIPFLIPKPPRNERQIFSKLPNVNLQTYILPLADDE